jgi:lactate dehydrogenase-like 2-hydroxyacid dehydrogenase
MSKVIVTRNDYPKAASVYEAAKAQGLECITAPDAEADLAEAVRQHGARHVIVGVARYAGPLYAALPRGGVIARFGVGHDGLDKARATASGLLCTNTPGVLDDSVAEHTLTLLLAAARRLTANEASARDGAWASHVGTELRGKTLAVIGCGPIGCRVAQIASFGFVLRVVGCEIRPVDQAEMETRFGFERVTADFAQAVAAADFVSLHIPSTPETRHFLNAERLAQIPPQALLVNTARGAVVDERALFDALAAGRLAAAALDVFDQEPYAPADPARDLRTLPNVLMTPHVGSATREACRRMALRALRNIRLAEQGEFQPMDLLNPAVLTAM